MDIFKWIRLNGYVLNGYAFKWIRLNGYFKWIRLKGHDLTTSQEGGFLKDTKPHNIYIYIHIHIHTHTRFEMRMHMYILLTE